MTAQPEDPRTAQADAAAPDPLGPVSLPKRGRIGARAMALVGTASVAAMAVHFVVDNCTTHTSIQDPH
ncbi:hypothetical protein FB561_0997 [Kribbella amoyensis]|uniref:Uncharacterized protein n=1 Tax=Kribbella amoyensis TaxID=996641 RepID=A0A561BM26_9ACTN|nr:hypothetical protein [Kribbella amoyensis]TWD79931.1 hypothetical protein FB561_0997 [Kribbella amoyensis]